MKAKLVVLSMAAVALSMAAVALAMTGCSNDENEEMDNWNGEIRLSSGLAVQQVNSTRAATDIQNGEFAENEEINVFVSENVSTGQTATTSYPQPLVYTAGTSGAMTTNNQPYYPASGNGVNIYAYYPLRAVSSFDAETVDFIVKEDQSSDAYYKASDLMYGTAANPVERTKENVNITFKHLLSKVTVTLVQGEGKPDMDGATVELLNVLPTTTLNPSTGVISKARGNKTTIKVMTVASGTLSGSAVVVPQTLNQEVGGTRRFIKVTLKNGGVLYSKDLMDSNDTPIENIEMAAGYEYKYEITVNLTSLGITSSITKWSSGDSYTGGAEME